MMKSGRVRYMALVCAAALGLSSCGTGAWADSAADSGPGMGDRAGEESRQERESTEHREISDTGDVPAESAEGLNELGLDAESMDILKYNIYVELNNTVVEIMNDISSYFLVVDTAEEFRFREDAEYDYGYRIRGFTLDVVEDAQLVYGMEPAYETLDGLVEAILPSMREIMETFEAIDNSGYTYGENHARLMACLEEFTAYANDYLDQMDVIADERSRAAEAKMLEEDRLILYNYSHMLTIASQILDEIYDQGIDDYNLPELDLMPLYPMMEELQTTAAAYDAAASDRNRLMQESLSERQVYAGIWDGLLQAFEAMIRQVESGEPCENPSREEPGGLQYICGVLSQRVSDYNDIFVK